MKVGNIMRGKNNKKRYCFTKENVLSCCSSLEAGEDPKFFELFDSKLFNKEIAMLFLHELNFETLSGKLTCSNVECQRYVDVLLRIVKAIPQNSYDGLDLSGKDNQFVILAKQLVELIMNSTYDRIVDLYEIILFFMDRPFVANAIQCNDNFLNYIANNFSSISSKLLDKNITVVEINLVNHMVAILYRARNSDLIRKNWCKSIPFNYSLLNFLLIDVREDEFDRALELYHFLNIQREGNTDISDGIKECIKNNILGFLKNYIDLAQSVLGFCFSSIRNNLGRRFVSLHNLLVQYYHQDKEDFQFREKLLGYYLSFLNSFDSTITSVINPAVILPTPMDFLIKGLQSSTRKSQELSLIVIDRLADGGGESGLLDDYSEALFRSILGLGAKLNRLCQADIYLSSMLTRLLYKLIQNENLLCKLSDCLFPLVPVDDLTENQHLIGELLLLKLLGLLKFDFKESDDFNKLLFTIQKTFLKSKQENKISRSYFNFVINYISSVLSDSCNPFFSKSFALNFSRHYEHVNTMFDSCIKRDNQPMRDVDATFISNYLHFLLSLSLCESDGFAANIVNSNGFNRLIRTVLLNTHDYSYLTLRILSNLKMNLEESGHDYDGERLMRNIFKSNSEALTQLIWLLENSEKNSANAENALSLLEDFVCFFSDDIHCPQQLCKLVIERLSDSFKNVTYNPAFELLAQLSCDPENISFFLTKEGIFPQLFSIIPPLGDWYFMPGEMDNLFYSVWTIVSSKPGVINTLQQTVPDIFSIILNVLNKYSNEINWSMPVKLLLKLLELPLKESIVVRSEDRLATLFSLEKFSKNLNNFEFQRSMKNFTCLISVVHKFSLNNFSFSSLNMKTVQEKTKSLYQQFNYSSVNLGNHELDDKEKMGAAWSLLDALLQKDHEDDEYSVSNEVGAQSSSLNGHLSAAPQESLTSQGRGANKRKRVTFNLESVFIPQKRAKSGDNSLSCNQNLTEANGSLSDDSSVSPSLMKKY